MTTPVRWNHWGKAAFERARDEGKPVLLVLDAPERFEEPGLGELARERYVAVLARAWERPDVHRRYASPTGVLVLGGEGQTLAVPERDDSAALREALLAAAAGPSASPAPAAQRPAGPVWTGAVGAPALQPLDAQWPRRVASEVRGLELSGLDHAAFSLLLYAAVEWSDAEAGRQARSQLEALAQRHWDAHRRRLQRPLELPALALLARDCAEAACALGLSSFAELAQGLCAALLELHDPASGAFRQTREAGSSRYADANALAALALLRTSAVCRSAPLRASAENVLLFLERQKYDPLLGMVHRRGGSDEPIVYGLLRDNAWTALAFTEAYLVTGRKPYREFADAVAKFMFQELWDRDSGGFLDRLPQPDDLGPLKQARKPADENAVAFEALWRLHHIKGNANYKKWLEWGLRALVAQASGSGAASLARVQDMLTRGRMDFELVGRVGQPGADALLAAVHAHFAPRRIVSFVDPDDQDYILAHKLEAENYPRLFACVELRRCADTADPDGVAELVERLRGAA